MGRHPWSDRLRVEDCLALDISALKYDLRREIAVTRTYRWLGAGDKEVAAVGYQVIPACKDRPASLLLRYTLRDPRTQIQKPLAYIIGTRTTACNFGQRRYWFVCPLVRNDIRCLKRVRMLYLPPAGRYFGCRRCYHLVYESCQTHDARLDRLLRLPPDQLAEALSCGTIRQQLLAVKASTELTKRLQRKAVKYCKQSVNRTAQSVRATADINSVL